jgi:hypothetical protein
MKNEKDQSAVLNDKINQTMDELKSQLVKPVKFLRRIKIKKGVVKIKDTHNLTDEYLSNPLNILEVCPTVWDLPCTGGWELDHDWIITYKNDKSFCLDFDTFSDEEWDWAKNYEEEYVKIMNKLHNYQDLFSELNN